MAVLVLTTGTDDARVDTLAVLASLLRGALAVGATTNTCNRALGNCKNENSCHAVSHVLSEQLLDSEKVNNHQ